ncbi:hypothetical protein BU26DRAFT_519428 [Trematosphaeria pertusa]|uniref:Actin-like ATPase domain-containing protein n=1 Tax=Trematosphaeria pertusa TaxID=390896 RepID=A0A6A6IIB2_9PLEO|nr:uncharacterized protein BU26DRAFT_519428 [Trematosphaeria pertusa]KAF2249310.1 hypothetical protein BU26DRAFT_519428 [Trematosphaeria pertusa]
MEESSSSSVRPPSEREGMIVQEILERRLVIGLDYGTTFTGVAYATPAGNRCALREIDVVTDWGPQMENHDKVPSVVSYSRPSTAREQQWGSSLSPNAVTMVHTKLELDLESVAGELDLTLQVLDGMKNLNFLRIMGDQEGDGIPAYSHKSPEEIVQDYLSRVFQYLGKVVEGFSTVLRVRIPTDIVVTVPTGWSYMAMNSTYRALSKAGFSRTSFPMLQDVVFVTEPEAAAMYTARYYSDQRQESFLRQNRYFILCDAGGGTVDVISYKVKQLQPTLQLEQIGNPTGRKCGSIFINLEFKKWLKRLIGEAKYRELDPDLDVDKNAAHAFETTSMRQLMRDFDTLKRDFQPNSHQDFHLDLPHPLANLDIPDVVNKGEITITCADMEHFFDKCVGQVVGLIKEHVLLIAKRGGSPKDVILVGGFGESSYLRGQIETTLRMWKLQLRRPETSWTAVVQGAVICGIEKDNISNLRRANTCKYDYCIRLDLPFSDVFHTMEDLKNSNGGSYAEHQLDWLLSKGDLVLSDRSHRVEREITISFSKKTRGIKEVPIYRYTEDGERPSRFKNAVDELEEACLLSIDLMQIPLTGCEIDRGWGIRPDTYETVVTLVTELKWERLEACVKWRDLELARNSVLY